MVYTCANRIEWGGSGRYKARHGGAERIESPLASGSATEVAIVFEGVSELLLTEVSKSVGTKAVTTAVLDCAGVEVLPVDVAVVVAEPALRVGSLWDG